MNVTPLRTLLQTWAANRPRKLEQSAAYKDAVALAKDAPTNPTALKFEGDEKAKALIQICVDLKDFVIREAIPCIKSAGTSPPVKSVVSPLAGGVDAFASRIHAPPVPIHASSHCIIATFNPGRCGFSALVTNELLYWRLEATAAMLTAHEVDICVTPGARFPPGARLPPDFPFAWLGTCSRSWGVVGCLVRVELLKAIEPLVDFGCERIFWLKVDGAEGQLVICAIYPAPGGDEQTWKQIIDEFHLVRNRFPRARVYILGDGNVHLASVVDHPASCTCLHCKQSAADTRIDNSIKRAGLVALNDGKPTHQSGTTIDVALAVPTHAVPAKSLLTTVGESDHWPIIITVPFAVIDEERCTLGRVCWSEAEWDDILGSISQMLDCLSDAITPLLAHTVLRPPTLGGCSTKKIRRALLDIAAWCRDVLYALAGHFAGAVKVRAKTRSRQSSALQPTAYESFKDFKAAVQAATWNTSARPCRNTKIYDPHVLAQLTGFSPLFSSQNLTLA